MTSSISGRAISGDKAEVHLINFRDFGRGKYRQLDDYAFGSGGMLFAAPQLKAALDSAGTGFTVYPSPQGVMISQEIIETLARQEHVIIICGHYEGIDERFTEKYIDLEVCAGDCVLTGGELPAMMIVDSMLRLVPGVVGKSKAVIEDSFYRGLLDNPNYTRPAEWEGVKVPEVLLSGNAGEVSRWRRSEAVRRTITRRPELISRASIREYLSGKVNIAVILNDDLADLAGISELCRAYDLGRPYIIARSRELRENLKLLCPEAKIVGNVKKLCESNTLIVKVIAGSEMNSMHSLEVKRRCLEHEGNILFVFAENEADFDGIDGLTGYIYEQSINVPLNITIGIALDRFLGKR